jgi:hypothetical protein
MKKIVTIIITMVSLNSMADYQDHGINSCMVDTYSDDSAFNAISALKCIIPIAKDQVDDTQRAVVFKELHALVRSTYRLANKVSSMSHRLVVKQLSETMVVYCNVEEKLEELEEVPRILQDGVISEVLDAGVEIKLALGKTCP